MGFSNEQMEQLEGIFKAEAAEYIKTLAEGFLSLEGGPDVDLASSLSESFRAAHSLKGASATLGFVRVSEMTHRLEDILGLLRDRTRKIDDDVIDLLLASLDIIRKAIEQSKPGDDTYTEEEKVQIRKMEAFLFPGADDAPKGGVKQPGKKDEKEITKIYRVEALEKVKALAQVLFSMEETGCFEKQGSAAALKSIQQLTDVSRTMGFERVAALSHRLHQVIDKIEPDRRLPKSMVELLLAALNVTMLAVNESAVSDSDLCENELQIIKSLEELYKNIGGKVSEPPVEPVLPPKKKEPLKKEPLKKEPSKKEQTDPLPKQDQEIYIRVAESKVDSVIGQVSELFESSLQISSLNADVESSGPMILEILSLLGELNEMFAGSTYENELDKIQEKVQYLNIHSKEITTKFSRDTRNLTKLINGAQEELRKIRLAPISTIFVTIRRQVREVSRATGKKVDIFLGGGEYAVDRKVLEAIESPLVHILRNAVDHGLESSKDRIVAGKDEKGKISVDAHHTGDAVELIVSDDGRGIDPEKIRKSLIKRGMPAEEAANMSSAQLFDYLFESGFSTSKDVTKVSGRGVGLDVVKYTVEHLGGEVRVESTVGEGTVITMRLPLAMSTVRCLLTRVGGKVAAIPASNIDKVIVARDTNTRVIGGGRVLVYDSQNIPINSLARLLELTSGVDMRPDSKMAVVVRFGERRVAFEIDELLEYSQLILKPLGDLLERVPNISGYSLLGSGELAIVLNPGELVRSAGDSRRRTVGPTTVADKMKALTAEAETTETRQILIVDDSIAIRTMEKTMLESAGFTVHMACDGYEALDMLDQHDCSLIISDVQMPNMDGIELTQTIKSRANLSHLPLILITSLGSEEDMARGMAAGADAYIVKKELTQAELISTINQLI